MLTTKTLLGIDAGGTFTDFVCVRVADTITVSVHKTLSTPSAPEQAILNGIEALGLRSEAERGGLHIIHGSTVATNATLEGKNALTAYVTNYGFGDTLRLARQTRPKLYALEFPPLAEDHEDVAVFQVGNVLILLDARGDRAGLAVVL